MAELSSWSCALSSASSIEISVEDTILINGITILNCIEIGRLVVFGQATGAKHVSTDDMRLVIYYAHFVSQHSCIISIVETVSIPNVL